MQAAVFDIETTSLGAVGAGVLLVACIRPLKTNRTRTFRIDSEKFEDSRDHGFLEREETALLKNVTEELSKYDLLIGHNIVRYDIPFLRTRSMRRGIQWLAWPFAYDTLIGFRRAHYFTVPNCVGKPSAGLDMVIDLFGIHQEKTKVMPVQWWESVWGSEKKRTESIDTIVSHCQSDVRMNAQMYPLILAADQKAVIRRCM
jgi:uncharacterized protein YprB with RNaseH-like and TPR domain